MKDYSRLEDALGVQFNDKDLLTNALVHRSYLNEHPNFFANHNERLEFLGDAVIELVVTDYLYKKYPNPEGDLTNWRASLVNSVQLAEVAEGLGMEEYIYLSRGEKQDKNRKARQTILANTLEAVTGAMYIDLGLAAAKKFIKKNILAKLGYIIENRLFVDAKSLFQETAQEKVGVTPNYKVLQEEGPDHAKHFKIGVYLEDEEIGVGEGASKQEAETNAASDALKNKGW